jgi:hypothetical protein
MRWHSHAHNQTSGRNPVLKACGNPSLDQPSTGTRRTTLPLLVGSTRRFLTLSISSENHDGLCYFVVVSSAGVLHEAGLKQGWHTDTASG